jgi:hypothetical protein
MCTPTSSVDLVVRVGPHADDQLRYTLRSLSANLPHARILTAGCRPHWTTCEHIDLPHAGGKFLHAYAVLRAILAADDLTDSVVIADDDMYLMRALGVLPEYHRGPLAEVAPAWHRRQGHGDTLDAAPDALCRDLHVPTLVDRAELAARLDALELPEVRMARVWWRTLAGGGCTQLGDVKVREAGDTVPDADWLSSSDRSWSTLAPRMRTTFPEACEAEAA